MREEKRVSKVRETERDVKEEEARKKRTERLTRSRWTLRF